jgi:hypothetical protein
MNFSSLFVAFVDLMDQLFYPGYVMDMSAEEFTYEFEKFAAEHS